jgi:hypothetical protein
VVDGKWGGGGARPITQSLLPSKLTLAAWNEIIRLFIMRKLPENPIPWLYGLPRLVSQILSRLRVRRVRAHIFAYNKGRTREFDLLGAWPLCKFLRFLSFSRAAFLLHLCLLRQGWARTRLPIFRCTPYFGGDS